MIKCPLEHEQKIEVKDAFITPGRVLVCEKCGILYDVTVANPEAYAEFMLTADLVEIGPAKTYVARLK